MYSAISYPLLALAAVVFITVFSGWSYSVTSVSGWTVSDVETFDNVAWDRPVA
jgi:hypothetical protein